MVELDASRAPEVHRPQITAAGRHDNGFGWLVDEVAERLDLDHRTVDPAAPAPPIALGREGHLLQRRLDRAEIAIGHELGDEEDIDIGGAQMPGESVRSSV